jgi:preprotein translocase subunit SecA
MVMRLWEYNHVDRCEGEATMDTRTGRFYTEEEMTSMRELDPEAVRFLKPVVVEPTPKQRARLPFPRVGRNEPCPCGSGKKFKKCCLLRGSSL